MARDERRLYLLRHLVAHLTSSQDWPRLFDLVESRGFLAEQADAFGDFDVSTGDMETHVVPAALEIHDWDRFLHLSLLALNLRGLAEALGEPAILRALAQGGQLALARGAAARVADPLRRAVARATLAASCRGQADLFTEQLQDLQGDLEDAPPADPEKAEANATALSSIARSLGPDLQGRWSAWIGRLVSEPSGARWVWKAAAESWLERGDAEASGLWEALRAVGDPEALVDLAPRALANLEMKDPGGTLERLLALFEEGLERWWQAAALFLGGRAGRDPNGALALWERLAAASPVPWSAALVDAGSGLFGRLAAAPLVDDPAVLASLRVVALEHRTDNRLAALALDAVQQIPEAEPRLHWSLRYLAARPPGAEVQGQVGAVLRYLSDLRYAAPAADLARYLDLVACVLPDELRYEVENVLWSPAGSVETLRALAERATQDGVLSNLLNQAERYAAAVAPTEAEGFQLRGEILIRVACRLCMSRKSLQPLQEAAERLLPEEENTLRANLARALAAENTPKEWPLSGLILAVCQGIHDRRLQLLAQLEALPPADRPQSLLAPASLYAALASIEALEDERLGLSALLDRPLQLQDLAARTVARMRDREKQNQALLRLAWHALGFESSVFGKRQDHAAAIELVRASLAVGSDLRLVALTPEIALLGAQRGGSLAVAELQEAARRVVALDAVPWPRRRAALKRVLSYASSVLRSGRRLTAVLEAVRRLPDDMEDGPAKDEVRKHWQEILSMLTAVDGQPEEPRGAGDEICLWLLRQADPFDPLFEPYLRRLWGDPPPDGETILGRATLDALRAGGRTRGEDALRLWLHLHLRPRPGVPQADRSQRCTELQAVMQRALALSTPASASPAAPSLP